MALEHLRLDGQVAIVTGAGRGVGRGIACVLAEAGATVVGTARSPNEVNETVAEIEKAGGKAIALVGDAIKRADNERIVTRTVERFGRIDILINNAGGMTTFAPFLEISEEDFKFNFDWNATSAFLLSQLVVPHMLKVGEGSIVNLSSGVGHFGSREMVSYGVAKAAVDQLTRAMAQALAPKIRVNCLSIGAHMTPALQKTIQMQPGFKEAMENLTPLKRIGDVENVGLATLYLCSRGCYATGAIFNIDGGLQQDNLPFKLPDL
jgi:NAD(P)-dependent dehydrogenase (short-subunit alcohol dehydrogenase family)